MRRRRRGVRVGLAGLGCLLAGAASAPASPAGPRWIWWEGERPAATNFPARTSFSPDAVAEAAALLSGGDWLTNEGNRTGSEAFARYEVDVPAAGRYQFWCRKFWRLGPFRWRFDDQPERTRGHDAALADTTELSTDLVANWVHAGEVELGAGRHSFELRLLAGPGEALTACFDCFLLIDGPFTPRGRLKPGERDGQADPGYFAWEPATDAYGPEAAVDLRALNEPVAGQSGFVRRDGERLLLGDGTPVRFWAVNCGPNVATQDHASLDYLARRLAKFGVNLVRLRGAVFGTQDDFTAPDQRYLDGLHYLVAALKRQGIYSSLSHHYPIWHEVRPAWGFEGYETAATKQPWALLFFEPRYQAGYRAGVRKFLTALNPHTGLSLAEDPAVAMVEIINEDGLLFWTFNKNIPAAQWVKLEAMFGRWVIEKYGSVAAALQAWGGFGDPGDDLAAGRAGVLDAWHMTRQGLAAGPGGKIKRVGDQVQFLTELQRDFYARTTEFLRNTCRFGGLVTCSNWQTSDAVLLEALERYTYTAGDVIARTGTLGSLHEGEGADISVRVGHTFESWAAVSSTDYVPFTVIQVPGWPHLVSELRLQQPNRWRADASLLASAYGSLHGIDGINWFQVESAALADGAMHKEQLGEPLAIGTFPACALAYRRGDIAESEPVLSEVVRLEDLYAMHGSAAASDRALEAIREADVPPGEQLTGAITEFDPLTFYVGKMTRAIGDDPAASRQIDLSQYIDRDWRTVQAVTGELALDYGAGLLRVDTPRTQGAAGFLDQAGEIALKTITIDCRNTFGQVVATSLDGQPLATSRRILVQAATVAQPFGYRVQGNAIVALGGWPWGVERIRATVSLRLEGDAPPTATVLDENLYRTARRAEVARRGAAWSVTLPADALYCLIERA